MAWFTYHQTSTGRLLSIASESVSEGPDVTRIEYADRPDLNVNQWDEATTTFIPRPPKVWIDRADDVINDARLNNVNQGTKNQVRNVINEVFGLERWRHDAEPVNIGGVTGSDTPPE